MEEQGLQFACTRDGVSIAYQSIGEGLPLLFATGWLSHLETEGVDVDASRFLERLGLGGGRRLIRFDWRGMGLSERHAADLSARARALDIEAVVDALALRRVAVFAWALGGPPAIIYAATHPEKVSHLVLYATMASPFLDNPALGRALVELVRADWRVGARILAEFMSPDADKNAIQASMMFLQGSASAETAAATLEEGLLRVDVRDLLPKIVAPTLVLHRREDRAIPLVAGRQLAALVPSAQFLPLAGDVHAPYRGDSEALLEAVDGLLGTAARRGEEPAGGPGSGLRTILFTDLVGSTALTQRLGDEAAQEVLRAHNAIIRERLREYGGVELKMTGDGFMAAFPFASRALDCAVAIQRAFAAYSSGGEPIRVRIGLNAGEPVAEDEDLFGTAVQAAARIASRAQPGQILTSDVVRQIAAGKTFRFIDRGRVQLKGFRERVRLFEVEY